MGFESLFPDCGEEPLARVAERGLRPAASPLWLSS